MPCAGGGAGRTNFDVANFATPDVAPREPAERFTTLTAKVSGVSERAVRLEASRGEKLRRRDPEARGADFARQKSEDDLDALAKLPEPEREALIAKAEVGEKVTVREEMLRRTIAALPAKRYGVILAGDPAYRDARPSGCAGGGQPELPLLMIERPKLPKIES
jgi:hypothetical protein